MCYWKQHHTESCCIQSRAMMESALRRWHAQKEPQVQAEVNYPSPNMGQRSMVSSRRQSDEWSVIKSRVSAAYRKYCKGKGTKTGKWARTPEKAQGKQWKRRGASQGASRTEPVELGLAGWSCSPCVLPMFSPILPSVIPQATQECSNSWFLVFAYSFNFMPFDRCLLFLLGLLIQSFSNKTKFWNWALPNTS